MEWEAIGALGEVSAAVGVIATLGYLAIQLRRNTTAVRSQTAQGTFQLSFDVVNAVAQGGNADIWVRFMALGLDEIEPEEQTLAQLMARATITSYDNKNG